MKAKRSRRYVDWHVGDRVTVRDNPIFVSRPYSNGFGSFQPGMVGVIGALKVPYVTYAYRKRNDYPYFVCVDYETDGKKQRVAVSYKDLKRI